MCGNTFKNLAFFQYLILIGPLWFLALQLIFCIAFSTFTEVGPNQDSRLGPVIEKAKKHSTSFNIQECCFN